MFNLWWHPAGHQDQSSLAQPRSSPLWHVRSWISGPDNGHFGEGVSWGAGARPPTPILSLISWRAFSICWGVPRMEKMRTLGSVLGGGFLCSSTWARDCSLMFLMVSPPEKTKQKRTQFSYAACTHFSNNSAFSTNAKHLWAEVGLEDSRSNLQVNSKIWSAQLSVLVRVYHNKAVKSLQLIGNKVMCLAQWLTHSPNMLKEPSL